MTSFLTCNINKDTFAWICIKPYNSSTEAVFVSVIWGGDRWSLDLHGVDEKVPDAALKRHVGALYACFYLNRDPADEEPMDA